MAHVQTRSLTCEQLPGSFARGIWTGIAMVEDIMPSETGGIDPNGPEDLEAVADRLEAALERIAAHLDAAKPAQPPAELAARLDGLIGRLRQVLGGPPEDGHD